MIQESRIRDLIFGLSQRIIKTIYNEGNDFPSGVVDNFVNALREIIDAISTKENLEDRKFTKEILEKEIRRVISNIGFYERAGNTTRFIRLEVPLEESSKIVIRRKRRIPLIEKPSILPKEEYE